MTKNSQGISQDSSGRTSRNRIRAAQPDFVEVLETRLSRRTLLHVTAGVSVMTTMGAAGSLFSPPAFRGGGECIRLRGNRPNL